MNQTETAPDMAIPAILLLLHINAVNIYNEQ